MLALGRLKINDILECVEHVEYWRDHLKSVSQAELDVGLHVAVFVEPYLTFVLDGRKTVESRFGVYRNPPYQSIREGDIYSPRIPNLEPLTVELAHFIGVARGKEQVRVSAADGVAVVRVLEAATASLRAGGTPVDLSTVNV